MALVTCPDCGREVSDQAQTCPNCGYPIAGHQPERVSAARTLQPPDHGIYHCFSGAKIPRHQRTEGQPCPFCHRTLSYNPTITKDRTTRRATPVGLIIAVIGVPILAIAILLTLAGSPS